MILVEGHEPGSYGGTGKTFDWRTIRVICELGLTPVVLAGGLTPGNVAGGMRDGPPRGGGAWPAAWSRAPDGRIQSGFAHSCSRPGRRSTDSDGFVLLLELEYKVLLSVERLPGRLHECETRSGSFRPGLDSTPLATFDRRGAGRRGWRLRHSRV